MKRWESRKFILTIACGIVVTAAFFLGKIGSLEWLGFLTTNVLGYGVLNLIEKPKVQLDKPEEPKP